MRNNRKWWKIPVILSVVFGFVPAMMSTISVLYSNRTYAIGGITLFIVFMSVIWIPTFIVQGIRTITRNTGKAPAVDVASDQFLSKNVHAGIKETKEEEPNMKKPPEIEQVLSFLDQVANNFSDSGLVSDIAKQAKKELLNKHSIKEFVDGIQTGKIRSVEGWTITYILNTAADEMESGKYHIYRGVMRFPGNLYKSIFEQAITKLVELGECTQEFADEKIRGPVYRNVQSIG